MLTLHKTTKHKQNHRTKHAAILICNSI